MNLSAALRPRVVITAFALQITKPNLIGLLRSPLIKVSHERIVFEHLVSRRCFLLLATGVLFLATGLATSAIGIFAMAD